MIHTIHQPKSIALFCKHVLGFPDYLPSLSMLFQPRRPSSLLCHSLPEGSHSLQMNLKHNEKTLCMTLFRGSHCILPHSVVIYGGVFSPLLSCCWALQSTLLWACSCIERGARKPCVETTALPPNSCLSWFTLLNPPVLLSSSVKWGYAVSRSSVKFAWYNTYKAPDTEKALIKWWFSLAMSNGGWTGFCLPCKVMFCSPRLMETFLYRHSPLSSLYSLTWWQGYFKFWDKILKQSIAFFPVTCWPITI